MEKSGADTDQGITRGELLKAAAVATPAFLLARHGVASAARTPPRSHSAPGASGIAGMNVLLFLTDQQRAVQHFPPGWTKRNMPGMTRLLKHGMLFDNAFTNACMCSPARSTIMSGYFPAQHGVKYTLETDMPTPQYPQVELGLEFKNLATVTRAAGYAPVYKGKFHCNKARERLDLGPLGRQPVRLHPLGPTGRRRRPEHPGGGRRRL
jgi:choline-sulfatase